MDNLLEGPKTVRTIALLPVPLRAAVEKYAKKTKRSLGDVIRESLATFLHPETAAGTAADFIDSWATGGSRFEPAGPFTTERGDSCGLCDSTAGCSHPQLRCIACRAVGLAENMTPARHTEEVCAANLRDLEAMVPQHPERVDLSEAEIRLGQELAAKAKR